MSDLAGFFAENGYCVVRQLFAPEEMSKLEGEFDRIVRQCEPVDATGLISTRTCHLEDPERCMPLQGSTSLKWGR